MWSWKCYSCHVSLTGHCPKMSLWKEHVPCKGWLYPVWVPQTLAHVYHSDAWNDQPDFVPRYGMDTEMQSSCCLPFIANLSVPSKIPARLSSSHPNSPGTFSWLHCKEPQALLWFLLMLLLSALGERNSRASLPSCLFVTAPLRLNGWKMLCRTDTLLAIVGTGPSLTDCRVWAMGSPKSSMGKWHIPLSLTSREFGCVWQQAEERGSGCRE